jgi:hypothetical protein
MGSEFVAIVLCEALMILRTELGYNQETNQDRNIQMTRTWAKSTANRCPVGCRQVKLTKTGIPCGHSVTEGTDGISRMVRTRLPNQNTRASKEVRIHLVPIFWYKIKLEKTREANLFSPNFTPWFIIKIFIYWKIMFFEILFFDRRDTHVKDWNIYKNPQPNLFPRPACRWINAVSFRIDKKGWLKKEA